MGLVRDLLEWFNGLDQRGNKAGSRSQAALRSCQRGLRCEPLEQRCLLSLGTYALVAGPAAGTDSDVVTVSGTWTATANASWLHTSSSGTGNGLARLTFDANAGATRTGTLDIAGQTLTVTQAGAGYVAANPLTTLVSSLAEDPDGVAVDSSGNVFIADAGGNAIKEWNASTQTVSTLVSSGLNYPEGLAVDASGNVYIASTCDNIIKEWNASTQTVSTLVSSGLNLPAGVAVDGSGNVYIADSGDNAIKEWNALTQTVSTLVLVGAGFPGGLGGGRLGQRLHRRLSQLRDQGVECVDADGQHPGFRVGRHGWRPGGRGRGRLGQRLLFRTCERRLYGVERVDPDGQHPGLLGTVGRGAGRLG